MPTYEYKCLDCGVHFENFQSIFSKPLNICPSCGGRVTKLISAGAGLIFKGNGFYITDYKRKESKESKKEQVPENGKKHEEKEE